MNQPSREAIKNMLEYFKKVSAPRILAKRAEAEKVNPKKEAV
ncbi:hypothetical protein [Bacillus sp. SA1-12]|nr:hypothetical protein [Bacillus sp. SA1-12]